MKLNKTLLYPALFSTIVMVLFAGWAFSAQATDYEREALGWGWAGASSGSYVTPGIISFNCENLNPYYESISGDACGTASRPDYNVTVEYSDDGSKEGEISGLAWIGAASAVGGHTIGWIDFQPQVDTLAKYNRDDIFPEFTKDSDGNFQAPSYDYITEEVSGWARIYSMARQGDDVYGTDDWGWIKLRGEFKGGTSTEYGVTFYDVFDFDLANLYPGTTYGESEYGKFIGWGYSGNGSDGGDPATTLEGTGLGFMQFDISNVSEATAWFQALYGNIYSRDGISAPAAPTDEDNATFLILTDGAIDSIDISTSCQFDSGESCVIADYGELSVPTDDGAGIYRSTVGRINIDEMVNDEQAIEIVKDANGCPLNLPEDTDNILKGKVYYSEGDLKICDNLTIANGDGDCDTDDKCLGQGTIIVEGNLYINDGIFYDESVSTSPQLSNLASLAWIVTGDIIIDPSVLRVSGAFIVLGDNGFSTGLSKSPLDVYGLVMAKKFALERVRYSETSYDIASEKFTYDGRVFINTPPGLENLLSTLPELSTATP